MGFPKGSVGKESVCSAGDTGDGDSVPGSGRTAGEGSGHPLVFFPENPHGQRSLVGSRPKSYKESYITDRPSRQACSSWNTGKNFREFSVTRKQNRWRVLSIQYVVSKWSMRVFSGKQSE